MSKLMFATLASVTMLVASATHAAGPVFAQAPIEPMPAPELAPTPTAGSEPVVVSSTAIPLYDCVRYKDERNIAPCAVPQIVFVKDPCATCDPCNRCAAPKCVAVQICVPPCSECPPRITCRRGGEYVRYDYGQYRVEITSRKGVVKVDYDKRWLLAY